MSKKIIKQHNAITEARYEITALEKDILYMLLAQIKDEDPEDKKYYKISFFELEQRFGKKLTMPALIEAAEGLVFRAYTIKKEDGGVLLTSLISSVTNLPEENSIQLGVGSMVRPYLLALKKDYTEFQLDTALRLKSKYSKRMYEMLSQHKKQGKFIISVEELKYRLALIDPKTGEEKYPGWRMFADQILERPQKELNEQTDITFTYIPIKKSRKYTDIEFTILPNPKKEAKYEDGLFEKTE